MPVTQLLASEPWNTGGLVGPLVGKAIGRTIHFAKGLADGRPGSALPGGFPLPEGMGGGAAEGAEGAGAAGLPEAIPPPV